MHAIILAGGRGTRLRPFTVTIPKPLVPVGDYPIMEVIVRQLKAYGVRRITISTGYLAGLIEAYFGNGDRWGVAIEYVREEQPLSTAGALRLVREWGEPVLVMNGDILTTLNFRELVDAHAKHQAAATIATTMRQSTDDFGIIESDPAGYLTAYREKPVHTYFVSMGVYVLMPPCRRLIGDGEALGMPDLLLRIKAGGEHVYCFPAQCEWFDIGRMDDYENAQRAFERDPARFLPHG